MNSNIIPSTAIFSLLIALVLAIASIALPSWFVLEIPQTIRYETGLFRSCAKSLVFPTQSLCVDVDLPATCNTNLCRDIVATRGLMITAIISITIASIALIFSLFGKAFSRLATITSLVVGVLSAVLLFASIGLMSDGIEDARRTAAFTVIRVSPGTAYILSIVSAVILVIGLVLAGFQYANLNYEDQKPKEQNRMSTNSTRSNIEITHSTQNHQQ